MSGRRCEECVSGRFALSAQTPDGCSPCFCSGLSSDCEEQGGLYRVPVSTSTRVLHTVHTCIHHQYLCVCIYTYPPVCLSIDGAGSLSCSAVIGQPVGPAGSHIWRLPAGRRRAAGHPSAQQQPADRPALLETTPPVHRPTGTVTAPHVLWTVLCLLCTLLCTLSCVLCSCWRTAACSLTSSPFTLRTAQGCPIRSLRS